MRIFVLGTGRCGTDTFIRACSHITNYTASHESRCGMIGAERFEIPDNHIEADNRWSWFLGSLDERFGPDVFYVHLLRDPNKVAESYNHRWGWRFSIVDAFGYGILHRRERWPESQKLDVCKFYVETVTTNIRSFLKDKPNHLEVHLEKIQQDFPLFWQQIHAQGNLEAAMAEWNVRHNATPANQRYRRARSMARWLLRYAPG